MGRKHNNKDDMRLPPYVYRGRVSYEWRPYNGPGVKRPNIKLCKLCAPISEVWRKWEESQGRKNYNLAWLLNEYKNSDQFNGLAPNTVKGQSRQIDYIIKYPLKTGKTFGSVHLDQITRGRSENI